MARAYSTQEMSDPSNDPRQGEWHALRGELVALLDQVEGRYARVERPEPAFDGLSQRVRNLRDQVVGSEPAVRRREALRTVQRAVDRFSERDDDFEADDVDALSSAIAQIRGRQLSASAPAASRRPAQMPEFRELNALVNGLSGRLERLEGELKAQRDTNGSVSEVASQVEQLTHVVELLAGAVGETGQVKRLESQIGSLAALIAEAPSVDLSTINGRLDDVSATVGKLAELQAQQMEREIEREHRRGAEPPLADALLPAMDAIEANVRNVYDRIDAIERNVALSSSDFERLTTEMAAFTRTISDGNAVPAMLVERVEDLAAQISSFEASNGDVVGLKQDISALHHAVIAGMEPRFARIEDSIEALAERIVPADTGVVEGQLKQLMQRMDDASVQLDHLAELYAAPNTAADVEAIATLVAERTSDAVTRKAPAPVAMFGPESLKSIEDQLTGLLKRASREPDYETLASLVAERTTAAVAKSASGGGNSTHESFLALEQRMTALLNSAGKDTAERLTRLEASLTSRGEAPATPAAAPEQDPVHPVVPPAVSTSGVDALDTLLAGLGDRDAMPANPADEAPLIDPGFVNAGPVRSALAAEAGKRAAAQVAVPTDRPVFDPATVERPPRPQSSLVAESADNFVAPPSPPVETSPGEAQTGLSSTSTFVAAARRAQRARQDGAVPVQPANSAISRAFARFRPAGDEVPEDKPATKAETQSKPAKEQKAKAVAVEAPAPSVADTDFWSPKQSFLVRYRRPLLLAGALAAVSLLALNLVVQRMAARPAAPVAQTLDAAPAAEAIGAGEVSLVKPEARVIDMVDNTVTASIAPATGFTKQPAAVTSIPSALLVDTETASPLSVRAPVATPAPAAPVGSDAALPTSFELPAEGIGPLELREAAASGDARAQFEVAAIYTEGLAVGQDYAAAAKWYERAAAQSFVPAQYRLGNLYETGTGVEKDLTIAKLWYQRAAEAGNRMAMHNLAALYASGEIGDQQFETAAEWFQQAAARGMTDSQFNLGMLYARGLGVGQDLEQSYIWFSLAARNGDADAAKARDDIAKSLSADAVNRLGEQILEWRAEPIELAANFAPLGTWSSSFDHGQAISTREVVAKVQQALAKLGFDIGSADGLSGPKTAEAIKSFERGTGMSESGTINPRLLAVLGSQPV